MKLFAKVTEYGEDFTTVSKTFDKYRWYKPIFLFILIIIGLALIVNIGYVLSLVFTFISSIIPANGEGMTGSEGIFSALMIALITLVIFLATKIVGYQPFSSFLTVGREWRWDLVYKSLIILIPLYIIMDFMIGVILKNGSGVNSFTVLTLILCIVIVPFQCLAEEVLYRGFFMQTFGAWFKIPAVAIILSAFVFMLSHGYNSYGSISVLIIGVALGLFTWNSKGIEISTAIHVATNISLFLVSGFGFVGIGTHSMFGLVLDICCTMIPLIILFLLEWKWNWLGIGDK